MQQQGYYVYILTNFDHTVLYIGVTGNLAQRLFIHQQEKVDGFSARYHATQLIYSETYTDINEAIAREKQLKRWSRKKKERLITNVNPYWDTLMAT